MSPPDKVIDRIRKLLALSRSSNPHEAAVAAARAAALMTEHQLAEASLEEQPELEAIGEHCLDAARSRVSWKLGLAAGVCRGFSCDCFQRRTARDGQLVSQTMVVGRRADVDTVMYMYAYLAREIDRLAADGWRARAGRDLPGESVRRWKNAFRLGAATEITARLRAARDSALATARAHAAEDSSTRHALVRIDEHANRLAQYMAHLRLAQTRRWSISSFSGLAQGQAAGRQVNLGRNPGLGRPARQLEE